jgi:hypothetical protein
MSASIAWQNHIKMHIRDFKFVSLQFMSSFKPAIKTICWAVLSQSSSPLRSLFSLSMTNSSNHCFLFNLFLWCASRSLRIQFSFTSYATSSASAPVCLRTFVRRQQSNAANGKVSVDLQPGTMYVVFEYTIAGGVEHPPGIGGLISLPLICACDERGQLVACSSWKPCQTCMHPYISAWLVDLVAVVSPFRDDRMTCWQYWTNTLFFRSPLICSSDILSQFFMPFASQTYEHSCPTYMGWHSLVQLDLPCTLFHCKWPRDAPCFEPHTKLFPTLRFQACPKCLK